MTDSQINVWANTIWDLCRPEEMYEALERFREEVRGDAKEGPAYLEGRNQEEGDARFLALLEDGQGR